MFLYNRTRDGFELLERARVEGAIQIFHPLFPHLKRKKCEQNSHAVSLSETFLKSSCRFWFVWGGFLLLVVVVVVFFFVYKGSMKATSPVNNFLLARSPAVLKDCHPFYIQPKYDLCY